MRKTLETAVAIFTGFLCIFFIAYMTNPLGIDIYEYIMAIIVWDQAILLRRPCDWSHVIMDIPYTPIVNDNKFCDTDSILSINGVIRK